MNYSGDIRIELYVILSLMNKKKTTYLFGDE